MYASSDTGATWQRVGENLPMRTIVELRNRNGIWYAATDSDGVWELRNDAYGQPGAAPIPSATYSSAQGGMVVSWSAVANANEYIVYRGGKQLFLGKSADLSHVDRTVLPGNRYCYSLGSANANGLGLRSTETCKVATSGSITSILFFLLD